MNKITQSDGTASFIQQDQFGADLTIKVNQNVSWTGGSLFLKSSLSRFHRRALADAHAHPLTGRTADDKQGAGLQIGLLQKLRDHGAGFVFDFFVHKNLAFLNKESRSGKDTEEE